MGDPGTWQGWSLSLIKNNNIRSLATRGKSQTHGLTPPNEACNLVW